MLVLNGAKFAQTEDEFTNELFSKSKPYSTCVGFYKPNKASITILDYHHNKIGVINAYGVLCAAKKTAHGWWYSHATIDQIGHYESFMQSVTEPKQALRDNGIAIKQG